MCVWQDNIKLYTLTVELGWKFCFVVQRSLLFALYWWICLRIQNIVICHVTHLCSGGSEKKMFLDKKGFCSPESGSVVSAVGIQEITVVFEDLCSVCTTIVVTVKTIFRIREENYFLSKNTSSCILIVYDYRYGMPRYRMMLKQFSIFTRKLSMLCQTDCRYRIYLSH